MVTMEWSRESAVLALVQLSVATIGWPPPVPS